MSSDKYKEGIYEKYKKFLIEEDFFISDVAILSADEVYLNLLSIDDDGAEGSFIASYNNQFQKKWDGDGTGQRECYMAIDPMHNQLAIVEFDDLLATYHNLNGSVFGTLESNSTIQDTKINRFIRTGIKKVKEIKGRVYACGGQGTVFRRDKPNEYWTDLSIPIGDNNSEKDVDNSIVSGVYFRDIDGFNHKDIYVCGDEGHLWHFNGKNWRDIDLPTMTKLIAICCAPGGIVFVGGRFGELWMGKDNKWHPIPKSFVSDIEAIVWYNDMLLVGTKLELKAFDLKEMKFTDLSSVRSAKNMVKSPDGKYLLVAGKYELTLVEGTEVTNIISW